MVLYQLNPLVGGSAAQAHALLFDMNKVYESYVVQLLRKQFTNWKIEAQVTDKALGSVGSLRAFPVRPDLLLTTDTGQIIVADTKWKRLKPEKAPTYDVSNADAYQMLAYSELYQQTQAIQELWLIYPRLSGLPPTLPPVTLVGDRTLRLVTVDPQV